MLWAAKRKKTAPLIHNNLLLKPFGILCLAAAKQRLNNKNTEPLALLLSSDGQPSEQAQLQVNAVLWSRPDTGAPSGCSASCIARAGISHCWAVSSILREQQQMCSEERGSLQRSLHGAKPGAVLGLRTAARLRWRAGRVQAFVGCFFKGLREWAKPELLVWAKSFC